MQLSMFMQTTRRATVRGLTLVELVIVMTIICGVLTAAISDWRASGQEDGRYRRGEDRVQHRAQRHHHVEGGASVRGLSFGCAAQAK